MLDPGSWTKYYSTFNQKNCHLALKIWVGDPGTVSGHSIPDPDPLHKKNRIQVHNCGSGSESRIPMKVSKRNWIPDWRIQMRTASYEYRKAEQLRTVSCGSDLGQLKNRRIKNSASDPDWIKTWVWIWIQRSASRLQFRIQESGTGSGTKFNNKTGSGSGSNESGSKTLARTAV